MRKHLFSLYLQIELLKYLENENLIMGRCCPVWSNQVAYCVGKGCEQEITISFKWPFLKSIVIPNKIFPIIW